MRYFLSLTLLIGLWSVMGGARAEEAIGQVSLVIGNARLIDAQGAVVPVKRGMAVRVGDRIETDEGDHVHLRFIDGAFASVRPGSRLTVESYRLDADDPRRNAIRLKLEQGVVRSVTGKGAEAARDRFRLNTPIAAIGVRGTDFIVAADSDLTRITVHSGAVIAAPIGAGCQAEALGPCDTAAARLLSAEMGNLMLELQRQQSTPRMVPLSGPPLPERVGAAGERVSPVEEGARSAPRRQEPASEALAVQSVTASIEKTAAADLISEKTPVAEKPGASSPASTPPAEALDESAPVIPSPVVKPPAPPAALVWGHWARAQIAGDTLSLPLAEAREGRNVTVGNDYWALYRPSSDNKVLPTDLGRVEFTLRDGQVFLVDKSSATAGEIKDGWFGVDFAKRQFATRLDVYHASIGDRQITALSDVRKDGIFILRQPDLRIAGALTLDGKEAGYAFDQNLGAAGVLTGITRWYR